MSARERPQLTTESGAAEGFLLAAGLEILIAFAVAVFRAGVRWKGARIRIGFVAITFGDTINGVAQGAFQCVTF
jgi:hypothetical protein